jgi:DNA-binding LytR/AlgR family response regulator
MRCHRAFIVNTKNVSHIEGNAAGYRLSLKSTENKIPVSRNYGPAITEKLKA